MDFKVSSARKADPLQKMAANFKADGRITPQEARNFTITCFNSILKRNPTPVELAALSAEFTKPDTRWGQDISKYIGDLVAWKAAGGR